jgi:hypothetical protein
MLPYCNFPVGQECQMKAAIVICLWSARFDVKVLSNLNLTPPNGFAVKTTIAVFTAMNSNFQLVT